MNDNAQKIHPLVQEALVCLQSGYFEGALRRTRKLAMSNFGEQESSIHIEWLARVYLGGSNLPTSKQTLEASQILQKLSGGQGLAEYALVIIEQGRIDIATKLIEETVIATAFKQNGQIVTWHPSALLKLAEIALQKLNNPSLARNLVNICLGYRATYASLDDVERLATILTSLEAPIPLWVDWAGIFLNHLSFAGVREQLFETELRDSKAIEWANKESDRSNFILEDAIQYAPLNLIQLLKLLSPKLLPSINVNLLIDFLDTNFQVPDHFDTLKVCDSSWFDDNALRLRYFWYDMTLESDKGFARNGDWALSCIPTKDFSMGVAQWWRLLESVLKCNLAQPLLNLFQKNPSWVEWDKQNLSPKLKEKESIFLDKLTNSAKTEKLTLGDLVLLLDKCAFDEEGNKKYASRLRMEAVRLFKKYPSQIKPLTQAKWLNPIHLNQENVSFFRNKASHDSPMNFMDASIGRYLAKCVLDVFFNPVMKARGFNATIIV